MSIVHEWLIFVLLVMGRGRVLFVPLGVKGVLRLSRLWRSVLTKRPLSEIELKRLPLSSNPTFNSGSPWCTTVWQDERHDRGLLQGDSGTHSVTDSYDLNSYGSYIDSDEENHEVRAGYCR